MHAKLKITLLFTVFMFLLLSILCGIVYYFSFTNRIKNIKLQLTNRAVLTVNMLEKPTVYYPALMHKIDSINIFGMKNKSIWVYNEANQKIYSYSDKATDTLTVPTAILERSRIEAPFLFSIGNIDALVYFERKDQKTVITAGYDEQGRANLAKLKIVLFLILTGGVIIAFTMGYFFSKLLLRPIRKIADEVNSISAQSLTHRINEGQAKDEWNYLIGTFNNLLNRLQESFELQRRFISVASHELSTPLTSISSQLEVSLQRDREAKDYMLVMQSVYQDVRQLSKLTQTLLEFASVSGSSGGIELTMVRVDEVLMLLPGEITKLDNQYSVKLSFDNLPEDETSLLVFGNAELLFTAIKNIVANACKYSANKHAKVKLEVIPEMIIISVEDEGKGIPETELENIFQPFYRAEDSRSTVGFGIGLPLVNRIIKLHKGYIKIESVVGKGTLFSIELPTVVNFSNR